MKDYRVDEPKAAMMTSRQIVDEVLFAIGADAPSYVDDEEMGTFLNQLNPAIAAIFSAWMATGFIANGSLLAIYETCAFGMIVRAPYGFHLLGKDDIASAIERSFRMFPGCILPSSIDERIQLYRNWEEPREASDPTFDEVAGHLDYSFEISDAYERTDALVKRYRFEFIKP